MLTHTQRLERLRQAPRASESQVNSYETKKQSLLARLRRAPVIAALSLLAVYSPVNADGLLHGNKSNVFTALDNSPLKASYEYVDANYQDQTPGARLAHLFNERLERNNVGNLNVSNDTINRAAIEQSQIVLAHLRARGIENPSWIDIQNVQGDYTLANQLAAVEDKLGATGTASYTRVVFSDAPNHEKQAISDLTYTYATDYQGWKPFSRYEDVDDLSYDYLQNVFPGQDTPQPNRNPGLPADIEKSAPLTPAQIDRALDGDTTNTPDVVPVIPADPADVLTTPATPVESRELRDSGILNFIGPDGVIVDPLTDFDTPNVDPVDPVAVESVPVPTVEAPEVNLPSWLTSPLDSLRARFQDFRTAGRKQWPLGLAALASSAAYLGYKRLRSRNTPAPTTSGTQPFPRQGPAVTQPVAPTPASTPSQSNVGTRIASQYTTQSNAQHAATVSSVNKARKKATRRTFANWFGLRRTK